MKKIAIFHNFLDNIGGAEVVTLTLARELDADIYTTNIDKDKIGAMGFKLLIPRIHSLGKIPKMAPFRHQFAFWKFRKLDLKNKYDFYIISGDWAMSGAVNNHPNLWYVHSPLNELWQFKDYIRKKVLSPWKRPLFDIFVSFNRKLTKRYANHVDAWICNSKNTQSRIKKYYQKDATIINPPIYTKKYHYKKPKNYWLAVNRLITHKRIELQMKAFSRIPKENLIIVGSYEKGVRQFESYKQYLESIKPQNVKIINWVDDKELSKLYSECKGFIITAKDEDFGMSPVEAMASGKPVIAPNEGGFKESIIDGKTGILIDEIDEEKIINEIKKINNNLEKYKVHCIKRSEYFDTNEFIKKIKKEIENYENKFRYS